MFPRLQKESPCSVANRGYFRTLLLQTRAKGGGMLLKREKFSILGFVYPSTYQSWVVVVFWCALGIFS